MMCLRWASPAVWMRGDRNRERILAATPHGTPLDVVTGLALMASDARASILATLPRNPCHARMMMNGAELCRLGEYGIAVGLHGDRHVPLTSVTDVAAELTNAHDALARLTEGAAVTTTLGCPHGRYDDRVLSAAQNIGIRLVFTSDKLLNATQQGMLAHRRPLGRLGIIAAHLEVAPHRLDPAAAARWLWPRERR